VWEGSPLRRAFFVYQSRIMSSNPYQSPSYESPQVPENPVYYEMNSTKLTLREYWRMSNGLLEFLIAAVIRILRLNVSFKLAFANTTYLQEISPEQVPDAARKPLRGIVEHAKGLGLTYEFAYVLPTVGNIEGVGAVMRNESRDTVMIIVFVRTWVNNVRQEKLRYGFVTQLNNGSVLVTSGAPRDLEAPENLLIESYPKREMQWVLKRHQERILQTTSPAVQFSHGEGLKAEIRSYEEKVFGHQIERGVYVPVDLAKLERLHAQSTPPPTDSKPSMASHGLLDIVFIVMLILPAFLYLQQPEANIQQQIFRAALALIGIIGIGVLWITRLVRANRST